jgi:Secretion system C-terminal sorting domain
LPKAHKKRAVPLFNMTEMKLFIRILLFLLPFCANGQMHDAIWNSTGWTDVKIQNGDTTYTIFSSYLDFRKQSPPPDSVTLNNEYGGLFYSNYFCDSTGSPRIFTDGHEVWHAKGPKFENGDSLQPSWYPWYVNWGIAKNVEPGYMVVLPMPERNDEYYLFALDEDLPQSRIGKKSMLYTHLKGVDSDSTGIVAEKNVELIKGRFLLPMESIKHANGRDWWILVPEYDSIPTRVDLNIFLLTPKGVQFVQKQQIASIEFVRGYYWHTRATPNGEKIVMNNILDAYVMDFDRCTGTVSGIQYLIHDQDYSHTSQIAFSPNSRFWYYATFDKVTQFDLEAPNILLSRDNVFWYDTTRVLTTVGQWQNDSTRVWPEFFYHCDLAYDGKIYLTYHGLISSSYISKPNEKGWKCKPVRQGLKVKCGLGGRVQHPNFRLGPLDGTTCDSLGLDNKPLADFWWFIDPDSTGRPLYVEFQDNSTYEPARWWWWFKDGTGQISTDTNAVHTFPGLGVYEVCMEVCNQNACDTICKLVEVGRPSVATEDVQNQVGKLMVFPNPATSGFVTIDYELANQPADMSIWNEQGQMISTRALPQNRSGRALINIDHLDSGVYLCVLRDSQGGKVNAKIVVAK